MPVETLIAGIGSILRGDDGVGMRVIDELEKEQLPDNVTLHGADISGLDLLKYFPEEGRVIIIDAADMQEDPGTVKVFSSKKIEKSDFNDQFSTHGMGLLETVTLAHELGTRCEITIVGVQPLHTDYDLELSDLIKEKLPEIVETVKGII